MMDKNKRKFILIMLVLFLVACIVPGLFLSTIDRKDRIPETDFSWQEVYYGDINYVHQGTIWGSEYYYFHTIDSDELFLVDASYINFTDFENNVSPGDKIWILVTTKTRDNDVHFETDKYIYGIKDDSDYSYFETTDYIGYYNQQIDHKNGTAFVIGMSIFVFEAALILLFTPLIYRKNVKQKGKN